MDQTAYNVPEPPEELLRCFDENNVEVEPRTRQWLKDNPNTLRCGVGTVWIINSRGEILCSKRSPTLHGNPNKWQTYFGGKMPVGSTPKETAIRELAEEIGIEVAPDGLFTVKESHRVGRYMIRRDGEADSFKFPDGEITEVRWMGLDDIIREQRDHLDDWCNAINAEQEESIRRWTLE